MLGLDPGGQGGRLCDAQNERMLRPGAAIELVITRTRRFMTEVGFRQPGRPVERVVRARLPGPWPGQPAPWPG